ncbi:hypothetical protein LXA43DRAFT_391395 [Ganoderma leucocontextum]|nr:hypothetical protein LXA43DRAFT_391395 [Ganoderma leucocontextum]
MVRTHDHPPASLGQEGAHSQPSVPMAPSEPPVLHLPYDVLQHVFAHLSPVDILHSICSSKQLYYPLIDDGPTWRPFCAAYGVTDASLFLGRSFRLIYGRLLHTYGPLLGLWCSDYPFKGNIIEFRLLPDHWLRMGEPTIIGDVWKFSVEAGKACPNYPTYTEFIQIGFTPRNKITPKTTNDVHVSWHLRSDRDVSFLAHNGIPRPWMHMDGDGSLGSPSLHVIAPSNTTLELADYFQHPLESPEFPDSTSIAWYDAERGVPRLPQEGPPPVIHTQRRWMRSGNVHYVEGILKPASISVFPPPDGPSEVRLPDLHNPMHPLSSPYSVIVPRYYPLRTITQEGQDPASRDWRPESLVGLWLGDYGPHGTECLFLQHDVEESMIRAWKITGDVNVPRGACSWHAFLRQEAPWTDSAGQDVRAYLGEGRIAHHGFSESSLIPARVIISGRDDITVSWDTMFTAKYIRYRAEQGRTGDN